jgi:hypothetical protein
MPRLAYELASALVELFTVAAQRMRLGEDADYVTIRQVDDD